MIILLEGADCTGKTTLAETLVAALGEKGRYKKHDQNNNSIFEFSSTLTEAAAARRLGQTTIIDRLWLSEIIYGPVMRQSTNDPGGAVMSLCHMHGVVTICCVREDKTRHLKHFREIAKTRGEYAEDKIERIINLYWDVWYGNPSAANNNVLLSQLMRNTPLRMLRSYYQYDMDSVTAEQFANWTLRAGHGN